VNLVSVVIVNWNGKKFIQGLRRALEKRRRIQAGKKVTDEYIWSLFEKERLLPRLTRRLG